METKIIRRIGAAVVAVLWLTVTAFAWFSKPKEISQSERRPLAQMPEISLQAVFSGKYMEVFEDGALDQFPARDQFRQFKSIFHYYGLKQTDNNGVYLQQGHAAKLLYPMNDKAVEQATTRLGQVRDKYLKDTGSKIYMAIIPDKSYYLAQEGEILAMDYDALFQTVERELPWATYIDLTQALQIEDYYTTDIHWRQENLFEVAQTLAQAMDVSAPKAEEYIKKPVDRPFYGVYYGQAALPLPADTMYLMEHEQIAACTVYDHETGKTTSVYDLEKQGCGLYPRSGILT